MAAPRRRAATPRAAPRPVARKRNVAWGRVVLSDANVLAWRPVYFEDGSGRGSPEDWLASGCWPDASRSAPKIAVVRNVAYYAAGARAVALPAPPEAPRERWWHASRDATAWTWPEAWAASDSAGAMLEAANRVLPSRLVGVAACACARTAMKYIPAGYTMPQRTVDAAEAWARGAASSSSVANFAERLRTHATSEEDAAVRQRMLASEAAEGEEYAHAYADMAASADHTMVVALAMQSAFYLGLFAASDGSYSVFGVPGRAASAAARVATERAALRLRALPEYRTRLERRRAATLAEARVTAAVDRAHAEALARLADLVRDVLPWHVILQHLLSSAER